MAEENTTSITVEESLRLLEERLAAYEKFIGLTLSSPNEAETYLSLTKEQLAKLSPSQCAEGAYLLGRSAIFIQKQVNQHNSRIAWAKSNIDYIISGVLAQYGGQYTPNGQKRVLAIKDNEVAIKFQKLIVEAQLRIDRLQYIAQSINHIKDTLVELGRSRRGERQI